MVSPGLIATLITLPQLRQRAVKALLPWLSRETYLLPSIFFETGPVVHRMEQALALHPSHFDDGRWTMDGDSNCLSSTVHRLSIAELVLIQHSSNMRAESLAFCHKIAIILTSAFEICRSGTKEVMPMSHQRKGIAAELAR